MKLLKQGYFKGERALFKGEDLRIEDSIFADGESPLKESRHIQICQSIFKWKYPLWYSQDIQVEDSTLLETARSGIWYTKNIVIKDSVIEAPKTLRRSQHILLENVDMPMALETLWNCQDIDIRNVKARGDYFGMNSQNMTINQLNLTGNYCFDGAKNIEVHNSKLISKDAFWNCENVIVYDSTIVGEYLGWNSKNVTFINCTIESLQGLCYIENLKLANCKLINTTLAFEYSIVDADVITTIDSVMNPISGVIKAPEIYEVIMDETKINPENTMIIVNNICKKEMTIQCVCN